MSTSIVTTDLFTILILFPSKTLHPDPCFKVVRSTYTTKRQPKEACLLRPGFRDAPRQEP